MQWISKWHLISTQEINFTSETGWGNPGEGHKGLAQREKGPWKALATQLNIPCMASGISLVCMCVLIILKETWLGKHHHHSLPVQEETLLGHRHHVLEAPVISNQIVSFSPSPKPASSLSFGLYKRGLIQGIMGLIQSSLWLDRSLILRALRTLCFPLRRLL